MKKVSIIIPVYNGEKNILNCIDNLLHQTYSNIEIIVVNDGSTDGTKKILNKIAKKEKKVKIINKKNEGVSRARNYGISKSTGDYIIFVDSDDNLVENAIEILINNIQTNDVMLYGFKVYGTNNRKNDTDVLKKLQFLNNNLKEYLFEKIISTKKNLYGYAWRAIYSADLINNNNITFPDGIKISEDYMFLLKCIYYSKKPAVISSELYIYIIGESSMSIKYIPSLFDDMNYVNRWVYQLIVSKNNKLEIGYYCCVANTYLRYVQNTFRRKGNFFSKHNEVKIHKNIYRKAINKTWYRFNQFSFKSLIAIILFEFNLEIFYEFLFNLKNICKKS